MTNENERSSSSEQHPFFHTMVLMGSALAIGCGGMSNDADAGGGRSGAGGSGGTGPTGGSGGTGGVGGSTGGVAGMGGSAAIGGTISIPNGGRTTVDPGPFTCTPAQWDCANDRPYCLGDFFSLPDACRCDETRPTRIEDCESGQVLACRIANYNAEGMQLSEVVPFECSCVAQQLDCGLVCDDLFGGERGSCTVDDDGRSVLCGCAVIVLR